MSEFEKVLSGTTVKCGDCGKEIESETEYYERTKMFGGKLVHEVLCEDCFDKRGILKNE